ncbi:MAG: AIR synthase family protein [Candidatus Brocadiia bacterium]
MKYHPGKLEFDLLSKLLESNRIDDERVEIQPAVGEDVCAIRMGDRYLVAKTDPITFATDRIGWYVVQVNANDLATAGVRPRWFLVTALLPENNTDEELVRSIWDDLQSALDSIDCELCGGHTEVTVGLDRPILVGHMLGDIEREGLIDKSNTCPGDRILVTKGVPVEGTAIVALEKPELLRDLFSEEEVREAKNYLEDPGIGVLEEAMIACDIGGVHAMHDPTEGGIATGLWELGQATELGMRVEQARIPLLEPGLSFCRQLGLDPLGVISSGAMLIVADPDRADSIRQALQAKGIECADIGEMLTAEEGAILVRDGEEIEMPTFPQDEITKLWSE